MTPTSEQQILLYDVQKDSRWIIYWLPVSSTFGVTNFNGLVYEINLDVQERRKLMGNIAESLLKNKWSNIFKSKSFVIEKYDDESALLTYVTRPVELPRIVDKDKIMESNKNLFFGVYSMLRDYQQNLPSDKGIKPPSNAPPVKKGKWNQPKTRNKRKPGDYIVTGPISFDKEGGENNSNCVENEGENCSEN
ncbi:unnamed protein product [Meloidogyne enterolobii]|uniref:Uncharacterized protein n=1 Tax=Meloidogyne enterolobii TaxID=390850 RepID=A0ACB1A329_MELEN